MGISGGLTPDNIGVEFCCVIYARLSYTRDIHEDPVRPGLLYLGTENILYVSFDDGDNWQPLMNNMPVSPMYGIEVQKHFNDLVVGDLRARLLDPGRHHAAAAVER